MSGLHIVLPHGTAFVTADEIPALLALAINPVPPFSKTIHSLGKVYGVGRGGVGSLTESDMATLTKIWALLPDFEAGMGEANWSVYDEAFKSADDRPNWTPLPMWTDAGRNAQLLRTIAAEDHKSALLKAIERGDLAVNRATRLPTTHLRGAIVMLASFETYAEKFGVTVRVAADPASEGVNQGEQARSMITHIPHNTLATVAVPREQADLHPATPETTFLELERAATHLAHRQWEGVDDLAAEEHLRRRGIDKGTFTALHALRLSSEAVFRPRVEGLVKEELLPLYAYPEYVATTDPTGAWVNEAELIKLVMAYKLPVAGAVPITASDAVHVNVLGQTLAAPGAKCTSQAAQKIAREDGRLAMCEAEGLVFDKFSLLRLPDGVGVVATDLGITRQSMSTDVKAALTRRVALEKEGKS